MSVLVQAVCRRPQAGKLLGAELGQFGKQIFELRSAHAQLCSENLANSTKSIRFANRALFAQCMARRRCSSLYRSYRQNFPNHPE